VFTRLGNSSKGEPIWRKSGALSARCRGLAKLPIQILGAIRAIRAIATTGKPGEFLSSLSGKQRAISLTFRRPNFTKFARNMTIGEAVNSLGIKF